MIRTNLYIINHIHNAYIGAPPNSKTPVVIAELAKQMAADHNLECTVLGQVYATTRTSLFVISCLEFDFQDDTKHKYLLFFFL